MRIVAFIALSTSAFAATDGVIPQAFSRERYEETRTTSPFVLATKVEPEKKEEVINPFQNLYVTGLGRADGKEYVTIVRVGEEQTPIRLWGNTPGDDGLAVQQVIWSDIFGKSKVKLKKGSDVGEVGFNENAIKSAVAGTPVAPTPGGSRPPTLPGQIPQPGQPPQGFNRPTTAPTAAPQVTNTSIPRPPGAPSFGNTGASIPRPPGSFTPPSNTGGNNGSSQGRQRVRVINSGPGR